MPGKRKPTTLSIIYIGEHFYAESWTSMSPIYGEDGTRQDWWKLQLHLSEGGSVSIRQATDVEKAKYERMLRGIKSRKHGEI